MQQRIIDIILALFILILTSPIFLVVTLLILIDDFGPVFYRASRIGVDNKEIGVLKFRSMVVNADKIGGGITTAGDPRVTRIGRILRKYKLDELPQFINVLCGDMSIVGARPEDPRYVALYSPQQRQILQYRPGITSPASLTYRNEESLLNGDDWGTIYVERVLPKKLAIDLDYLTTRNLFSDLKIILQTVQAILE